MTIQRFCMNLHLWIVFDIFKILHKFWVDCLRVSSDFCSLLFAFPIGIKRGRHYGAPKIAWLTALQASFSPTFPRQSLATFTSTGTWSDAPETFARRGLLPSHGHPGLPSGSARSTCENLKSPNTEVWNVPTNPNTS